MILIIMFAVIVCACIGVAVWILKTCVFADDIAIIPAAFACISAVALGILGCMAIICNTPHSHYIARMEYEERVASLNATYNTLIKADDSYAKYTSIQQYNSEVREFKQDIIVTQANLKNPWINWLNNYEYKNFDADVVSYIELGD